MTAVCNFQKKRGLGRRGGVQGKGRGGGKNSLFITGGVRKKLTWGAEPIAQHKQCLDGSGLGHQKRNLNEKKSGQGGTIC